MLICRDVVKDYKYIIWNTLTNEYTEWKPQTLKEAIRNKEVKVANLSISDKTLQLRLKNLSVIRFHNPNELNGYLSNWARSEFCIGGRTFICGEQYMMYSKAKLFNDTAKMNEIYGIRVVDYCTLNEIKLLGRQVRNFSQKVWDDNKIEIMYRGLLQKFDQNDELKRKLLLTKEQLIAECAVKDKIWGIGLGMNDVAVSDPTKWRGENLLGHVLMRVRNDIAKI